MSENSIKSKPWYLSVKEVAGAFTQRVDNPFTRAIGAGSLTVAAIAATTAFAPIGVVGAAGWVVVYCVTGGTFSIEAGRKLYKFYSDLPRVKQKDFDAKVAFIKKAHEDGLITKEERDTRIKALVASFVSANTSTSNEDASS